ncbi:Xaa-Pro peptidase family protein [Caldilinea sp.]|uniref:Xaa-Pro peptidase family protein n=1 Tax=Caldilinea sp. TaxID=2293560 RepID=UPI002C978122|nr:Xaa-Pro peptidase family protein [Caldilinea sp.]
MHEAQRQRTCALLQARQIDAALFASPASITWLTGFAPPVQTGANPFAGAPPLVWWDGDRFTLIVVDGLASLAAPFADEADGGLVSYLGYTLTTPLNGAQHVRTLLQSLWADTARAQRVKRIGVESWALPAAASGILAASPLGGCAWVTIDGWLAPLRMVKSAEELAKLRDNFRLTDIAHAAARQAACVGAREIDVWLAAKAAVEKAAGCRVPMGNDCVVGYRTENIGGWPLDHALRPGDSLIVDLSTIQHGYWSDSCATYVAGEASARQQAIHAVVSEALAVGAGLLRPGAVAGEIDRRVREIIVDAGYPVYPHHTGHGVGVTGHEAPRLVPDSQEILTAGMVILLEPGVYFAGETGVRLEDAFLITEDGAVQLTTHDKSWAPVA